MDKKLFKSYFLLIFYSILLIVGIVKIDLVFSFISKLFSILSPLFIGMALAFILNRPFEFFKKRYGFMCKKNNKPAIITSLLTVYLLLLGTITGIFAILIPQLSSSVNMFYGNLGLYGEQLNSLASDIANFLNFDRFDLTAIDVFLHDLAALSSEFLPGTFPLLLNFTTNAVISVVNILLGLILSVYILADKERIKRQFSKIMTAYLPPKILCKTRYVLNISNKTFGSFVLGQLTEALILGVLCFIGMLIIGFHYPLLISVIVAVTSLIPVVGPIIGAIPAIFILLMAEPLQALWFIVFIVLLQQFEGNIIYPRVVGHSIGLPPLWVLIAIIIGGGLMGVLGMLISVPAVSVLYQLLKEDVNKK